MTPESQISPTETGLVIQQPAGLMTLSNGGSPALSEIITRAKRHLILSSYRINDWGREKGENIS